MIPATSAATISVVALPYQWVAVGASGGLVTSTSTTLASWTSRTSSFGTTQINNVASNGTTLYVAVGDSGKVATSPDGITWTQRTSGASTASVRGIAYGNGYWMYCGSIIFPSLTHYVAYSTDGITWTQNTTGISATAALQSIEYGNGTWVILSASGEVYTASSPTGSWTSRTSTLSAGAINGNLYCKPQSIWVQGADNSTSGTLQTSTDAITWTARNLAFAPSTTAGSGAFAANNSVITFGARVDGTTNGDIESSTNGTTWTNRTPATTASIYFSGAASDESGLIAYVNSNTGNCQTSSDGATWSNATSTGIACYSICHSSGRPAIR